MPKVGGKHYSYSAKGKLRIVAILVATDPITVVSFQVHLSR